MNATTTKAEAWKAYLKAVRENFPGPNNADLRRQLREIGFKSQQVGHLGGYFALTASGEAGLAACEEALQVWASL